MKRVPIHNLSLARTKIEWDRAAATRRAQICGGIDHSATQVLAPAIRQLLASPQKRKPSNVLDVGCGVGWLSRKLIRLATHVTAIDPSRVSIEIAKSDFSDTNISYLCTTVQALARKSGPSVFDAAVANMTLSVTPALASVLGALAHLLKPKGALIFTIPHPCFWPQYWRYSEESWFNYLKTIAIQADFRISNQRTALTTTHIHRPLEKYFAELHEQGLVVDVVRELLGREFSKPRFLVMRCINQKNA